MTELTPEELARWRQGCEAGRAAHECCSRVETLLDEVDRLTEALEAALSDERHAPAGVIAHQLAKWKRTAERAEADLADEKRRHAELRAGVEALANDRERKGLHTVSIDSLRTLLSDTTTGGE